MTRYSIPLPPRELEELPHPWRSLAAAVLLQAIEDAQADYTGHIPQRIREAVAHREDARQWLQRGGAFDFWCEEAGLNPEAVAECFL